MSTEFSTLEYFHGKKNSQDEKVIILIIVCKADNSWKKNHLVCCFILGYQ